MTCRLLAFGAEAVEDHFGVADGVAGADVEGGDEGGGDLGLFEAFDFAAGFADEVGVGVGVSGARVVEGVAPDAVFAADAVENVFGGEGVEGAVDGDGIGMRRKFFEDLDGTEGTRGFGEDFKHARADGGAAEFGAFEEAGNGVVGGHVGILGREAGGS